MSVDSWIWVSLALVSHGLGIFRMEGQFGRYWIEAWQQILFSEIPWYTYSPPKVFFIGPLTPFN